jgi:hypothetical protein
MAEITWIASYPKSGNTWLRFMLASYLTKEPVTSVRTRPLNALIPVIGGGTNSSEGGLPADRTGPLLVKTHSPPGADALRPYRAETRKAVYLVRNPRDIILSMTNAGKGKQKLGADDIARAFIANRGIPMSGTGSEWANWTWPENARGWTTPALARQYFPGIDVLTVRYEDMRADPLAALIRVLEFLDLGEPVAGEHAAQAAESSALENMRALSEKEAQAREARVGGDGQKVKVKRFGQGLTNQSLACLGEDVEDAYQKLFQADDDFAQCARQFGYDG